MRLRIGCSISHRFEKDTPMIVLLNVHYSRFADLEQADFLRASPSVRFDCYRDAFGNWCTRLVAPAGEFTLSTEGVIRDSGLPDPVSPGARRLPVQELPPEVLVYLLGSRYCETDVLSEAAWSMFGALPDGWTMAQAVCDYVHDHVTFDYMRADATRTAAQTWTQRVGVCRDFAHLAIAFCRCLNIPARYCTGYLSDIGEPQPWPAGDFAAWMEVHLDGRWHVFDPRNNARRFGRVLIAQGRDAADVPLTHMFGAGELSAFTVRAEPAAERD